MLQTSCIRSIKFKSGEMTLKYPWRHLKHEGYEKRILFDDGCQLDDFYDCVLPILSSFWIIKKSVSFVF